MFLTILIILDSNVSIECAPYGEPVPTVKWLGVHKNILMHDNKTNIESGLLTIRNLSIEDSGVYDCIAENSHGRITHSITLQVQGKYFLVTSQILVIHILTYQMFLFIF